MTEVRIEHALSASVARVEAALLGERWSEAVARGSRMIRGVTVLSARADGDTVERVARFAVTPAVFGLAAGWDERVTWSRATRSARFAVTPTVGGARIPGVSVAGLYALREEGAGTLRVVEVEVRGTAPVVGALVERRVTAFVRALFDDEAATLAREAR
ncbi:MAG: DUF2505 family protein [Polyangiales bacterium]